MGMKHFFRWYLCLAALTCVGMPSAFAGLPYTGQTLKILVFKDNHSDAVAAKVKDFELETGAKVVFDAVPTQTVAAKTVADQIGGGTYDLYAVDEPFVPQLAKFLLPFNEWPRVRTIAADGSAKFLPASISGASYQKVQYGLPVNGNVYMVLYRKDLFEDPKEKVKFKQDFGYDLSLPKTTQQMLDVAKFFHRPPELYGFAPFSKKSEGTTVECLWAFETFGTGVLGDDLKVNIDEGKAIAALEWYRALQAYTAPGSKSWHHAERMGAYNKGKIPMLMTWPSFFAAVESVDSMVRGKSGFGIPPAAPGGRSAPIAGTWSVAIPRSSKNQQLAAEFAHWWASSTMTPSLVKAGMNPAREDLLTKPDLVEQNPAFPLILENFRIAQVRPRFTDYRQASDIISSHFTAFLAGNKSAKEAVSGMRSALQQLSAKVRPAS